MMANWLHKKMRTHTDVHTPSAAARQRRQSLQTALRITAALQTAAQMLLWVTFYGYDALRQSVWLSALLLLAPLLALWGLWRAGQGALKTHAGRLAALPLTLCLAADGALLLCALAEYISHLIPEYPFWICAVAPAILCLCAVWISGANGVPYGCQALCGLILPLFLLGTLALGASASQSRLHPLLGSGWPAIGLGALSGCGCLWGGNGQYLTDVPLEKKRSILWTLLPWLALMVWALWYGMVRPWAPGDMLDGGAQLTALARHAQNVVVFEISGVLWLLLLPLSLTGCLYTGRLLLERALPHAPRNLWPLALLLPGIVGLLLWRDGFIPLLSRVLPWRGAVSLLCGAALWVISMGKDRKTS